MITKFSVKNFLSIKDEIVFEAEASSDVELLESNVFKKENILKTGVIYGHNASGKTNLLKSIKFMRDLVINSHKLTAGDNIEGRVPFKLDKEFLEKDSEFSIEFILGKDSFKYEFSCNDKKIISESLSKNKKNIFSRTKTKNITGKSEKNKYEKETLENMLYLSRATNLNVDPIYKKVFLWFKNNLKFAINDQDECFDSCETAKLISKNNDYKEIVLEMLDAYDLGIKDIEVKPITEDDIPSNIPEKYRNVFLNLEEFKISFIHEQKSNEKSNEISFKLEEESSGTRRIFSMIGIILDAMENKKTLFVDELERHLHPLILEKLVKIFNSKSNKYGQLIFTTHSVELLSFKLFRRDQIWFMEKEPNKNTGLISLFDYNGVRKDLNIKKAYFSGRFGGIPILRND